MKHLPKPLASTRASTIFLQCISTYRDEKLKKRLTLCAKTIDAAVQSYELYMPQKIYMFSQPSIPGSVTNKELTDVYITKFAALNSEGREYYNKIKANAPHGICPICELSTVDTLDHYLAKTHFPILSVAPVNLIPCCQRCNKNKLDYKIKSEKETPFHPYYDDVSSIIWLEASITEEKEVLYEVCNPKGCSNVQIERMKKSFEIYHLSELYGVHAVEEIDDNLELWKNLFLSGSDALRAFLNEVKNSIELQNLNSWKAALYRAMIRRFDIVETWL